MNRVYYLCLIICCGFGLYGCSPNIKLTETSQPVLTASSPAEMTPTPQEATLTNTLLPSATSQPQPTFTPPSTATVEPSPTPSPIPTYVKLRGEVTIDQAVCHYGPGAPYLYKYGVYKGSNLEILRRVEPGEYVEVQAIGGNNPCWVKKDYIKIKGDVSQLQPVSAEDLHMPPSPYYGPLTGVQAKRNGNAVFVTWNPLILKAGDSSEQTSYIVEAFVCQQGKLAFIPAGTDQTSITISDESGCNFKSRARVIAAEKHGYTRPVAIDWPQAQE